MDNGGHIYVEGIGEAYKLFHNGILALAEAEQQGMRVDVEYIEKKSKQITRKIGNLETSIYESKFFEDWQKTSKKKVNLYSPVQMGNYLYNHYGVKATKFTAKANEDGSQNGSTAEDALAELNIPEINTFLEIKKLKTLRDRYLAGLLREQVDGFIHPFFNLHLARTYRGSSDHPNFQNFPIREEESMQTIRGALYPRKGNQILELDYSQLEVRIATCYHLDPRMQEEIETGHDFHLDLAKQIFVLNEFDPSIHKTLRKAAKNGFVFPQFYGDYYKNNAKGLACDWCKLPQTRWKKGQGIQIGNKHISDHLIEVGLKSYVDFTEHLRLIEEDFWKNRYPIYNKWKETWWKEYQKNGYFVSKTGFLYKGVMSRNDATNYPVQGAAFHVLLWCLIQATERFKMLGMKTRIIGQIHDSIVLDVFPLELEKVIKIMKQIMERMVRKHFEWICVPLQIDAGLCPVNGSWAEKQDYKI